MARRLLAGLAGVALLSMGAAALLATARPVAVAAVGDRVLAVYALAGRTWLLPLAPRAAWAVPLPGGPVALAPARFGERPGLFLVAGGEMQALVLPGDAPPQRLAGALSGALAPPQRLAGAAAPPGVQRVLAADLDGDGTDELLLLGGSPPPPAQGRPGLSAGLQVWQLAGGGLRPLWQGLEPYDPWQLAAGPVGGGLALAVGTWTRAVYDPQWAERLWLYRWREGQPDALWLGSRLAHPFRDFTLAPQAPGESALLVALEAARGGGETLSLYRWNGFGFTLDYTAPDWQRVLAFAALPPAPGCATLAAVVEPGPTLVLLALPAADGPLITLVRRTLPAADGPEVAAARGHLWLLAGGRLHRFDTCRPAAGSP